MDVPAALDELFAAPREEFTPLRDRLITRARTERAEEVVRRLRGLRKPTVAAWLVNQVARQHPDDVARLAELGAELRESHRTLDGDRLRQLSHDRIELARALTEHARRIARDTGGAVSNAVADQLAATWSAAAAGADAAEQVRAGMLSVTLDGGADDWLLPATTPTPITKAAPAKAAPKHAAPAKAAPKTAAPAKAASKHAAPTRAAPKREPRDELAEKRRERADREARERERRRETADADVRKAEQSLATAEQRQAEAEQAATDAAEAVVTLRRDLDGLRRRLDDAIDAERDARAERTRARNAATTARRAVSAAERRQAQLD